MIEEFAGSNVNENGCAARVSRGLIDGLFRSSQPVGVVRVAVAVADVVVPAAFVTVSVNVVVVVMFATTSVPDTIPPAGLVPIAIAADAPGTRFRNWSFTVTSTAGVMCWPVVVVVGWTVNAAVAGAAALMSNAVLSSPGVPVTAACSL